ncbi:hypothetical protein COV15_02085 [Candidatus Woesearchaeota archaeon CG10_big_fil_rev_8_21_14_0_10_34_12]|nr:MAG: hypothetical protein COV15_02085 [Candidatus Woesearchaeota archaeon CG10_big_fil_rev_8_21_14_0_10_34_12]
MKSKLKKCDKCQTYTLKEKCDKCNLPATNAGYKFIKTKSSAPLQT